MKSKDKLVAQSHLDKKLKEFKEEIIEENEKIFFRYKSELIDLIDPILKEVVNSREHRTIITEQVSRNSDRIDKIERKLIN